MLLAAPPALLPGPGTGRADRTGAFHALLTTARIRFDCVRSERVLVRIIE